MDQLKLNREQRQVLQEVLERVLAELSYEIADTDRKAFRDHLKDKRERIREVADMLAAPDAPGSSEAA